ncbi:glycosyltransferase [Lentilitoribacter sp. Alg239-R112]|uniref:glycosyltransferase n=1 Tax=Lentilitoribacter sp. Alg239-R112 TaxID=2305987 RepID=UPI0013A6BC7D|nr:glycosyltransferase [Lentilitoribacter sp. Alg239-R112]
MTELSICVLTRDNQEICKTTISGILRDAQLGFELLVIDASKKYEDLKQYIDGLNDDRVRHVHVVAKDRIEHWNQAVTECKGDWITFISDSDHCDPKIVQIIRRMKNEAPDVESVGWNKVDYDWPEHRNEIRATKISLESGAFKVDKKKMQKRFFGFEKEGLIPFNIYHGIVKRELIERISAKFSGVYFEHPVTAYEFGYKVLAEANELAFMERPLSVISEQSEEMLSEATVFEDIERKKSLFYKDIEVKDSLSEFPFSNAWSPKILGAVALRWLADKYGDEFIVDGWESNFVKRREDECNAIYSAEYFDKLSTLYEKAIGNWCEGKFANEFTPRYSQRFLEQKDIVGCFHGYLFIDKNALGAANPAEFYSALENFIPPTSNLGLKIIEKHKKVA